MILFPNMTILKELFLLFCVGSNLRMNFIVGSNDKNTCAAPVMSKDRCYIKGQDRLQIVFLQDRTESYKAFSSEFEKVLPNLLKKIIEDFPSSEFGITSFADYSDKQGPIPLKRSETGRENQKKLQDNLDITNRNFITKETHLPKIDNTMPDDITGCYLHRLSFTPNAVQVSNIFKSVPFVKSGGSAESSLTGILFSAKEKALRWSPKSCDIFATHTFKMIVLLTEEASTTKLYTDQNRTVAKGDGTDNCEASQIPTPSIIKNVLKNTDIQMIGVLSQGKVRPNIEAIWKGYFMDFGFTNPQVVIIDKESDILMKIMKAIYGSLGEECEMADPPAYNTLGL